MMDHTTDMLKWIGISNRVKTYDMCFSNQFKDKMLDLMSKIINMIHKRQNVFRKMIIFVQASVKQRLSMKSPS